MNAMTIVNSSWAQDPLGSTWMWAWTPVAHKGESGRKWEDTDPGRMTWAGAFRQVSVQNLSTERHADLFYARVCVGMYKSSSGCLLALTMFGWASSGLLNVNVLSTGLTYVNTDWGVWTCVQFGYFCPRPRLTITRTFLLSLPFFSSCSLVALHPFVRVCILIE